MCKADAVPSLRLFPERPPPEPFRPGFWRSPLRGPRLTAILGFVLLIGIPIVAITGLLSNDAYQPGLGPNALGWGLGSLDFYLFGWPTHPAWLYVLTQGLHVTIGLALAPIVLAKLWSVIPRLFEWQPVRSPAHALDSLAGAARGERPVRICDGNPRYPVLVRVPLLLHAGALLLRRVGLHRRIQRPRRAQGRHHAPVPANARGDTAAAGACTLPDRAAAGACTSK